MRNTILIIFSILFLAACGYQAEIDHSQSKMNAQEVESYNETSYGYLQNDDSVYDAESIVDRRFQTEVKYF